MSELQHYGYSGTPERAVALILAMQFEFTRTGEPTDFEVHDPKGPLVHIHIFRPVIWEHSSDGAGRRLPHDYVGDLAKPAHVELLIRQADNDYSIIDVYADSRSEWLMVQPIVTLFLTRLGAKKLPETAIGDLPTDSDVLPDALIVRISDPAVPGRMIEDYLEIVTSDPADPSRTIRDYLTVQSTSDASVADQAESGLEQGSTLSEVEELSLVQSNEIGTRPQPKEQNPAPPSESPRRRYGKSMAKRRTIWLRIRHLADKPHMSLRELQKLLDGNETTAKWKVSISQLSRIRKEGIAGEFDQPRTGVEES